MYAHILKSAKVGLEQLGFETQYTPVEYEGPVRVRLQVDAARAPNVFAMTGQLDVDFCVGGARRDPYEVSDEYAELVARLVVGEADSTRFVGVTLTEMGESKLVGTVHFIVEWRWKRGS